MDLSESLSHLRHLALVGGTDTIFADDAVALLHCAANGLTRQLNNAATAALIAAAARGKGGRRRRLCRARSCPAHT